MKSKTLILGVFISSLFTATYAQLSADKIPVVVKESFVKSYPTAKKIKWDKEGKDFEASFENAKDELSVVFDEKGNIIEVEKEIEFSELPVEVQAALKGKKVKEVAQIMKNGKTIYEAEIAGKDLLFEANGQMIK
jgi:uncharacterized membrane protein YkoI